MRNTLFRCKCGRAKMLIQDFETGKDIKDVNIVFSREEAEEMVVFLSRLLTRPDIKRVYISEVVGYHLEREITVSLQEHQAIRAKAA